MASESRLYTFSDETKQALRKLRLTTSRTDKLQAVVYEIDKKSLEIEPSHEGRIEDVEELKSELPDHAPRYILLSTPVEVNRGGTTRTEVPYAMIYYLPVTCKNEAKMLYAGAKELFRNTSEANTLLEIDDAEDLDEITKKLIETIEKRW
ncbi:actin depolymerizing protein [Amniculicola lignicola CBS 123094]|uniref:Actin depolymerizing protein n=2 Tax=Amniculicola lignicola CBS 123094 TaxID=1392246 RepID=A0A6A5VUF9_9PLEO|nr:actin depolymerizing protein [Amniculicola lignicola CBS 123094]